MIGYLKEIYLLFFMVLNVNLNLNAGKTVAMQRTKLMCNNYIKKYYYNILTSVI